MPKVIVTNSNNAEYSIPVREGFSASIAPLGTTTVSLTDAEAAILTALITPISGLTFVVQQFTLAGSSLSGGARSLILLARDASFPGTNPAVLATMAVSEHQVLDYNDTTAQSVYFARAVPSGYAGEDLTVSIDWHSAAATTGAALWSVEFQRILAGTTLMSSTTFGTLKSVLTTVPAVAATPARSILTFSNTEANSIASKDYFRIRLARVAGDVTDNLIGNARVSNLEVSF